MPKTIELLKKEENLCVMALLKDDKNFCISRLSLFERFAFLCDSLEGLLYNRLREEFLSALNEDVGQNISVDSLKNRELQKKLWRILCDPRSDDAVKIPTCDSRVSFDLVIEQKELSDAIYPFEYFLRSQGEPLEELFDRISADKLRAVYFDASEFKYIQPDAYHCDITYQKIIRREECSQEEKSALMAWVLCRLLMRRDFDIFICAIDNTLEISKLLDLFERRKLFPDVYLSIESAPAQSVKALAELALSASVGNINILLSTREKHESILKQILYFLPLRKVFVCKK